MGMNIGHGSEDEPMMEINTTPLIDVMLVLLIMLIITIPIQTHAVRMDMPVNPLQAKPPVPPEVIKIDIAASGEVTWNGEVLSRQLLEERFTSEALKQPQADLHIKPDRKVHYKEVAMVLATAQRAGMQKLGVMGNEQFMDNQ